MRDIVQWSNEFKADSKPWLMLGKGPTFQKVRELDLTDYYVCSLNHVVRELPVTLAHIIDIGVVGDCAGEIYRNAQFLAMPYRPHVKNNASEKTLVDFCEELPILDVMRKEGRLLWYNLSSSPPHGDSPIIKAVYFSAEAALNVLVVCGVNVVRTLGVDGGKNYSAVFDDLKSKTLLANGHESFDRQFDGICETIRKSGILYGPLEVDVPIRIFVGTDAAQKLGAKMLEYSIKKHTPVSVEVIPIDDRRMPIPKDPRNRSRSGFSFCRFDIPRLCGFRGKALYMDADMQVFTDVTRLWNWEMNGAAVVYCQPPSGHGRVPQYSVMLMDCAKLSWDVKTIVRDLDECTYSYDDLMQSLCILPESTRKMSLPFEWNSLEHYEEGKTCLLHYTDMHLQPWVSERNPNGGLWYQLLKQATEEGFVTTQDIHNEIKNGHVSPGLARWAGLPDPANIEVLMTNWVPPYMRFVADNTLGAARNPAEQSPVHKRPWLDRFKRLLDS